MRKTFVWKLPNVAIELGRRTTVMGILNVTPDSFSDRGAYFERDRAVARALEIQEEGADILDIGGESSRPGSTAISEDEELSRVLPVVEALANQLRIPISVDTYRATVAQQAIAAGAQVINDISAFRFDSRMAEVVRRHKAGVVLMHSRGNRDELHSQAPMMDPVAEVLAGLKTSADLARNAGIDGSAIVVDPGMGFGKRSEETLLVMRHMKMLCQLDYPLLVGTSRKSFIGKIVQDGPDARLWGTAATVASSILAGAHIVRVHDIREMRTLVDVLDAIVEC